MRKSPLDHLLDWAGRIALTAILAFVLLPFVVVAIASFNDGAILSFPPREWSLRWYANAFAYRDFGAGLVNSLRIAAFGATIALIAGAGFAYVLDRYEFRFKGALNGILMSPLIIPNFTIGLGLLILSAAASPVSPAPDDRPVPSSCVAGGRTTRSGNRRRAGGRGRRGGCAPAKPGPTPVPQASSRPGPCP